MPRKPRAVTGAVDKAAPRVTRKRRAPDTDTDASAGAGAGANAALDDTRGRKRARGPHVAAYTTAQKSAREAMAAREQASGGDGARAPALTAALHCPVCALPLASALSAPDGETVCAACAQCAALPPVHTCINWSMQEAVDVALGDTERARASARVAPCTNIADIVHRHNATARVCISRVAPQCIEWGDRPPGIVAVRIAVLAAMAATDASLATIAANTDALRALLALVRVHTCGAAPAAWGSMPTVLGANELGVELVDADGFLLCLTIECTAPELRLVRWPQSTAPATTGGAGGGDADEQPVHVTWQLQHAIGTDVADDHGATLALMRAYMQGAPDSVPGLDCAICYNPLTGARMAACGHSVCASCATQHVEFVRRRVVRAACGVCSALVADQTVYATPNTAVAAAVAAQLLPAQAMRERLRTGGASGALGLAMLELGARPGTILPVCAVAYNNIGVYGGLGLLERVHAFCCTHFGAAVTSGHVPSEADRARFVEAIRAEFRGTLVDVQPDMPISRATRGTLSASHGFAYCAIRLVGYRYTMRVLIVFNAEFYSL